MKKLTQKQVENKAKEILLLLKGVKCSDVKHVLNEVGLQVHAQQEKLVVT